MRSLGIHTMLPFVEVVNERQQMCTIWVPVGTPARICATSGQQGPKRKLDHTPNPPGQRHLQEGRGFPRHSAARVSCSPRALVYTSLILGTRSDVHQGNVSQSTPRIRRGGRGSKLIDKGVSVGTEKARTSHRRRVVVGC